VLFVIKLGGGAGVNYAHAAADIASLASDGAQVVVVHGCSAAADRLSGELGVPVRYVTSVSGVRSRYTDAASLRVFGMAAALVNAEIVTQLQRLRVQALGLRGADGGVLRGPRKDVLRIVEDGRQRILRDDYTGRVERVNVGLLSILLAQGYVPVIAPLALADTMEPVNVDGDRAAAAIAAALGATTLVILSNVPGVLRDLRDERSLVPALAADAIAGYEATVSGGMRRKLMAAREALRGGVPRVILADGRAERPVRAALAGEGTVVA
jgi:[amino group carrier protein]-L-2-aminoadipate 6-kinase